MTYQQGGLVQATDFNTIVGTDPTTTDSQLNSIWASGGNYRGYGQTTISTVSANTTITASDWSSVVNKITTIANHQGKSASLTAMPTISSGSRVDYLSSIGTNIGVINTMTNRLSANAQGTTSATATQYNSTWQAAVTFTHTVTFESADKARYFFNAGGQLALTFSSPTGTGINALMNSMATNAGTIVLSSIGVSGNISIAGSTYQGVTQVGGSSTTGSPTVSATSGFYALSTTNVQIFKISGSGTPSGYTSSYITVNARVDSSTPKTIYFTTLWDEVPNGLYVSSGTTTTCTVRYPSTTYLTNSWGAVTVTGSSTGS